MGLITKLESQHYLKRFDNMDLEEKRSYLERVRSWEGGDRALLLPRADESAADFRNVMACATAWSDAEVKAWNEGVVLVTALVCLVEDGWLPDKIYIKSARRSIRFITRALDRISRQYSGVDAVGDEEGQRTIYSGQGAVNTQGVTGAFAEVKRRHAEAFVAAMDSGKAGDAGVRQLWTERPKHLDQYIHLLPERTQRKAAGVKELFLQLDMARENARKLAEDPHHAAADVQHWAAEATRTDNKIRAIFKEVDEEWAKVVKSGRVVVDDLGNARVVNNGQGTMSDGQSSEQAENKANAERVAWLRKWIIDTRKGKSPKHDEKWMEYYKEMVALGGMEAVTISVVNAAEYYGLKPGEGEEDTTGGKDEPDKKEEEVKDKKKAGKRGRPKASKKGVSKKGGK